MTAEVQIAFVVAAGVALDAIKNKKSAILQPQNQKPLTARR